MDQQNNSKELVELANMTMPYGKYKGVKLLYLPEAYLVWYQRKGFPPGKLGQRLALLLEIKVNGLEYLLKPLVRR